MVNIDYKTISCSILKELLRYDNVLSKENIRQLQANHNVRYVQILTNGEVEMYLITLLDNSKHTVIIK